MRRTRRAIIAVAVVVGGVIGVLALGGTGAVAQSSAAHRWHHDPAAARTAAPASAASDAGRRHAIVLNEVFGSKFTFVDTGEPGDSPGDYGVFQDRVTKTSGRTVGLIDVQCVESYASHCRGAITLFGRGQIVFDGATPSTVDPDRFAVTGGTGEFVGAGGTLTVSFPSEEFARLTVELAR